MKSHSMLPGIDIIETSIFSFEGEANFNHLRAFNIDALRGKNVRNISVFFKDVYALRVKDV